MPVGSRCAGSRRTCPASARQLASANGISSTSDQAAKVVPPRSCPRLGPVWSAPCRHRIKRDCRRIGHVQAFHLRRDRQARKLVAMRCGVLPHAFALGAEHQRNAGLAAIASARVWVASPVRPTRQKPASAISSSARARFTYTRPAGTISSAPERRARDRADPGGACRSGVTMPSASNAAAERRIAPTAVRIGHLVEHHQRPFASSAPCSKQIAQPDVLERIDFGYHAPRCGASPGTRRARSVTSA